MDTNIVGGTVLRKRNISCSDELANKKIANEITDFNKFNILVRELRKPVLEYLNAATLRKYSQCSKLCDSEVQSFNAVAPYSLGLIEKTNGINVQLWHKKMPKNKLIETECQNMLETRNYLAKKYKYVKNGTTRVFIDMQQWPQEILKVAKIKEDSNWTVLLYETMKDAFMNFTMTTNIRMSSLKLVALKLANRQRVILKPDFFKSQFIRNLKYLFTTNCGIDEEDFMNCSYDKFELTSSISYDVIRNKTRTTNAEESDKEQKFRIKLPAGDPRSFDREVLFPTDEFPDRLFDDPEYFEIGRVSGYVENYGRVLTLWIHPSEEPMYRLDYKDVFDENAMYRFYDEEVNSEDDE